MSTGWIVLIVVLVVLIGVLVGLYFFGTAVLENTPKYLRRTKVPVVKAKVGPRIMTLMCDVKVFELIPIKQEVKATVSGLYITDVKGVRGPLKAPKKKKKKGLFARFKKDN